MTFLIASFAIIAIAIMVVVSQRQSVVSAKKLLKQAQEKTIQLEQKIDASRDELKKSKDDLERERNSLREARELNKKKLRRQTDAAEGIQLNEAPMTNKALEDSQKALNALEAQIEQMKKDQTQTEQSIRARLSEEMDKKETENLSEIDELKKKIAELQEEVKKQKRMMRPEGIKIDLKSLPDEAACEFARVFRKAEQHERLHGIARAKLHLAQEKFTELQKRYFTVCRELALMAGGNQSDTSANPPAAIQENKDGEHV